MSIAYREGENSRLPYLKEVVAEVDRVITDLKLDPIADVEIIQQMYAQVFTIEMNDLAHVRFVALMVALSHEIDDGLDTVDAIIANMQSVVGYLEKVINPQFFEDVKFQIDAINDIVAVSLKSEHVPYWQEILRGIAIPNYYPVLISIHKMGLSGLINNAQKFLPYMMENRHFVKGIKDYTSAGFQQRLYEIYLHTVRLELNAELPLPSQIAKYYDPESNANIPKELIISQASSLRSMFTTLAGQPHGEIEALSNTCIDAIAGPGVFLSNADAEGNTLSMVYNHNHQQPESFASIEEYLEMVNQHWQVLLDLFIQHPHNSVLRSNMILVYFANEFFSRGIRALRKIIHNPELFARALYPIKLDDQQLNELSNWIESLLTGENIVYNPKSLAHLHMEHKMQMDDLFQKLINQGMSENQALEHIKQEEEKIELKKWMNEIQKSEYQLGLKLIIDNLRVRLKTHDYLMLPYRTLAPGYVQPEGTPSSLAIAGTWYNKTVHMSDTVRNYLPEEVARVDEIFNTFFKGQ